MRRNRSSLYARSRAIGVAASIAAVSCTAETDTDEGLVITTDTIGATEVVRSSGQPVEWGLTEVATIGRLTAEASEPAPDEFGRIGGVLADAERRIYVADQLGHDIRVFDENGRFLFRFGREGGGPGEIRMLQSIAWLGDTLAVLDASNGRLGLFTRDGDWVGHRPFMALTGDVIRLHGTAPGELYMPFYRRSEDAPGLVFVRHLASGPGDTLVVRRNPRATNQNVVCRYEGAVSFYSVEFAPSALNIPAPGVTLATAWTADYRIAFVRSSGDTVRIVERDVPPVSFTDAEWAEQERKYREWLESLPPSRDCNPESLPRPETKAMLRTLTFDDRGRMWVERTTASGFAYDVFDPEGRLIAEMPSPPRDTRHAPFIRGDRIYLVQVDSLDIESVHAFSLDLP